MKKVVIHMQNELFLESLKLAITSNDKDLEVIVKHLVDSCVSACYNANADIFIAEVRDKSPLTIAEWFVRIGEIKECLPNCKIIFIADEENSPKSATEVLNAYKEKKIDMFFFSKSGLDYLVDVVSAI